MMRRRQVLIGTAATAALGLTTGAAPAAAQRRPDVTTTPDASEVAGDANGRFRRPRVDHRLPHANIVRGERNIAAAWLADASQRYRHFKLGGEHEATTLVIATPDWNNQRLTLPADSVFEDRLPRLADLDGDGRDEVVLVRSYLKSGAAVAVIAHRPGPGGVLEIVAESDPLGSPFQWQNPAGIADFDGDGRAEIAAVQMPHARGDLVLYRLRGDRLVEHYVTSDVSNHASGSRHLALSVVADFDGDGIADLAIPSFDRRSLRFLSLVGGRAREIARVELPGLAGEDFRLASRSGRPAVEVGLVGGRRVVVSA